MRNMRLLAITAAAAVAAAQSPYECNFLTNPEFSCTLPYPSDFFFAPAWNASAPPSLTLTNNSVPLDNNGVGFDPVYGGWTALQGFSPLGPIVAFLPGISLDYSGMPRLWNISSSVSVASPNSVLLDATTLKPVQHWVELDHSADNATAPYERAMMMWPAHRLNDATRYIVAFRNLVDDEGMPLVPSDGFAALKYNRSTGNPALEASRARFETIFATLAGLGWAREELTLAWDFTTNTQDDITRRMLHMRDDALARIAAAGGFNYTITQIVDNPGTNVSRRIIGQFSVPCYLNYEAVPTLDSQLVLDPNTGLPQFQGFVGFPFEVQIPPSVAASGKPSKVLTYGHGLFGSMDEVETGYLNDEAQQYGYVLAATDWIGLSAFDEATVIVMMLGADGGFSRFRIVPDRLHQGMLNTVLLNHLLTQSAFTTDPAVTFNGQSVISTNQSDWFYNGNSQGGIMGSMYMAVTTEVLRGVCGVPGGPYGLLLPRSTDFADLFDIWKIRYPRSLDRMTLMALLQALWDRADPAGWVSYINGGLPNTPAHRVIWHAGLGDAQVTWLGAQTLALSAGAVIFESNAAEGNQSQAHFTSVPDDTVLTTGNLLMCFDYSFPLVPFVNLPPDDGFDAHECPRRTPSAQAQMAHFFETGEIINTCGGACKQPHPNGCG